MNDNEVIKALEMCGNIVVSSCKECSFHISCNANCVKQVMCNALDLINRQKADLKQKDTEIDILIRKNETLKDEVSELQHKNSELEIELKAMRGVANSYKAEIERLKHILVSFMSEVETWDYKYGVDASNIPKIAILGTENESIIEQTKAEAYKEFAERLEEKSIYIPPSSNGKFGVDVVFVEDVYNLLTELTEQ